MSGSTSAHRIDAALLRVAELRGLAVDVIRSALGATTRSERPLVRLAQATAATPQLFSDPVVRSAARNLHLDSAWDGSLARLIERSSMLREPGARSTAPSSPPPIDGEHLPEEGEEAYRQGLLLKTFDAAPDIVGLWVRGDDVAVYYASPAGFRVLARDPVRWVEGLVDLVDRGADPDIVRKRIERYVEAAGATRYRIVTFSGSVRALVDAVSARPDGPAPLLKHRLQRVLDALDDQPDATVELSTPPRGLDHLETVFSGNATALRAKLDIVLAAIEGKRHHVSVRVGGGGWLAVSDELSSERAVDAFERVAAAKARGERALLDISTSERGRLEAGVPRACPLDGSERVPEIKVRLEAFASATAAKRFAATVTNRDGSVEERDGIPLKTLLRSAAAFHNTLRAGGRVVVRAVGVGDPRATGSAPDPVPL